MMRMLRWVAGLLLVCGLLGSANAGGDPKMDAFAKCVSSKGAKMYGTFWCPHCAEQKELFGDSFQYITYVECGIPGSRQITQECKQLGLKRTPTWIFADGQRHEGKMELNDLSKQTGCPLP